MAGLHPSRVGSEFIWGSRYPGHHYSTMTPTHFSPSTPWQMPYGRCPEDMVSQWRYLSPMMYLDRYMGMPRYPSMAGEVRRFHGPEGMPMPWSYNQPMAAPEAHTSLHPDVIHGASTPMARGVTLQEPDPWRQAPGSLGGAYGTDDLGVWVPNTLTGMGAKRNHTETGMPRIPGQGEFIHVEPVTVPRNDETYVRSARASAAGWPVSRNYLTDATAPVVDVRLPCNGNTDTLQCLPHAGASSPAVAMQTGVEAVAGAQPSADSVPNSHWYDHFGTQIIDEIAQIDPTVPGVNYDVFPALPQGHGSWPSVNHSGCEGGKRLNYKLKKYSGVSDWADYIRHFEMVSAWNGWTAEEKAVQLTINLTGIARQAWVDDFLWQQWSHIIWILGGWADSAVQTRWSAGGIQSWVSENRMGVSLNMVMLWKDW